MSEPKLTETEMPRLETSAPTAKALAGELNERTPVTPWGYAMLGWVLLARDDRGAARQAFSLALDRASDPQDRQAIAAWLVEAAD